MAIKRALLSAHNKTGIPDFATALHKLNIEILASGNTAKLLRENNIPVKDVSDFTGSPEILAGRVKTLHPRIHAGILYKRNNPEHSQIASEFAIDLVCVNFYPFEETLNKTSNPEEILENIDIGGPTLVRAAAKNYRDVIVITSPDQYASIAEKLRKEGDLKEEERKALAAKAFNYVANYDEAISNYFSKNEKEFPDSFRLRMEKIQDLRYGENPHQKAASYKFSNTKLSFADLEKLNGKDLSYNNLLDIQAALELIYEFKDEKEAVAIVYKHTNPTGAARAPEQLRAFKMAFEADSLSAFGGVVAFNKRVDAKTAEELIKNFMEIVIAPDFDSDAVDVFKKKKNLRVIKADRFFMEDIYKDKRILSITGGLLLQSTDHIVNEFDLNKFKIPTKRKPTEKELRALQFAWNFMGHIKSNSVVFATDEKLLAVGAGQQSRVDSCAICIAKAQRAKFDTSGAVMASEAFFPFRDTVDFAASAKISAIIQPGGSIRDKEVIEAADEHGIAMILTGIRHFRH